MASTRFHDLLADELKEAHSEYYADHGKEMPGDLVAMRAIGGITAAIDTLLVDVAAIEAKLGKGETHES